MAARKKRPSAQSADSHMWQKSIAIANIFIAVCAIATILFSIRTNKQISETLSKAGDLFDSFSYPFVEYDNFSWVVLKNTIVNCDSPPDGISISHKNKSNAIVVLEKRDIRMFIGERSFDKSLRTLSKEGEIILSPGESVGIIINSTQIKEHYPEMKYDDNQTLFNFKSTIVYRSIATGKRYEHKENVSFLINCNLPDRKIVQKASNMIKELK